MCFDDGIRIDEFTHPIPGHHLEIPAGEASVGVHNNDRIYRSLQDGAERGRVDIVRQRHW